VSRKKFGKLLELGRRGDLAFDNPDDQRTFALWENFREHLRHGARSKRGIFLDAIECVELIGEVDQIGLSASRRGRNSPIGPKQHVAYLVHIAMGDYRKYYGRKRVPREIKYRNCKRAIEVMESKNPQWAGKVGLERGVPTSTDIRGYNWQPSHAMEIEGQIHYPDASKLMRSAWDE